MSEKTSKEGSAGKKKKVKKEKGTSRNAQIFFTFGIIIGIVFMPTTVLLAVCMLPTIVVLFVDRTKKKSQAITVGAMNLAGCSPFLLEMWTNEHVIAYALSLIMDPLVITVAYSAAGIGYMLDWSVTAFVARLMYQRGLMKHEALKRRKEELIERWGVEVTGKVPLDSEGFPLVKE